MTAKKKEKLDARRGRGKAKDAAKTPKKELDIFDVDVVESLQFLEAGFADSDDPFMTYMLASHALYGDDWNEPDPEKGRRYCEKAVKLGSPDAMILLAQLDLEGVGGRRDARSAWRLLNQAFELGDEQKPYWLDECCEFLGKCCEHGWGTRESDEEAFKWYRKSG